MYLHTHTPHGGLEHAGNASVSAGGLVILYLTERRKRKEKAIWLVVLRSGSVEFDGQVLSVLAEELAVVVVHGPERGEVSRLHGLQEVLPPAALQLHEALETPIS